MKEALVEIISSRNPRRQLLKEVFRMYLLRVSAREIAAEKERKLKFLSWLASFGDQPLGLLATRKLP